MKFVAAAMALAGSVLLVVACSGDAERSDVVGGGMAGGGGIETGPCDDGEERECGFTIEHGEGVVTCFQGTQVCGDDGRWSDCGEGRIVKKPEPKPEGLLRRFPGSQLQVLSGESPTTCSPAEACDPYCYQIAEPGATFTPGVSNIVSDLCDPSDSSPLAECTPGGGCEHSLCEEGAALTTALCGTCSSKVCTSKPSCCSGTWDESCVALAYNLCAESPPPYSLCDFSIFSLSTFETDNRPRLGSTTRAGSVSDLIIDTDASGNFPELLVSLDDIIIQNFNASAVMGGEVWAAGSWWTAASPVTITADVHLGGGMFLNSGVKISGTVKAAGTYGAMSTTWTNPPTGDTIAGQAGTQIIGNVSRAGTISSVTVIGTQTTGFTTAPTISFPSSIPSPAVSTCAGTTSFGASAGGYTVTGTVPNQTVTITNGVLSLPPGDYGNVILGDNGKLLLQSTASAYTFKSVESRMNPWNFYSHGGIQLGSATGTHEMTVCGRFTLGQYQSVIENTAASTNNAAGGSADTPRVSDPKRLIVHALATDGANAAVEFGNDANFTGVLIIPNGTFDGPENNNCWNPSPPADCHGLTNMIRGAVWAKKFDVGTDFRMEPISETDCEGLNIPGTTGSPPAVCSLDMGITVAFPGVPPSSEETCRSGLDCQINQRCTNVDSREEASSCAFDKCMATGAAVPSTCDEDPCVERIVAASSGCASNWSAACVALIPTECDATCGDRSGTCADNSGFSSETGCTGYDLALGYPCATTTIPVCNHGSAAFSGNVSVGYWDIGDRKFATASPGLPDGTCTENLTIAPGACEDLTTCTSLVSTDTYTLMVDPPTGANANGALSECGSAANVGRRLDNWSWFDPSFVCTTAPDHAEYEYLAECPDDTHPRWKNLYWVTTHSGGSSIDFGARVADTVADLPAETFAPLATNTVNCSTADIAPDPVTANAVNCFAPISSIPGLTTPHGQALGVRAEMTGSATVDNWEVTYSCEYDQ